MRNSVDRGSLPREKSTFPKQAPPSPPTPREEAPPAMILRDSPRLGDRPAWDDSFAPAAVEEPPAPAPTRRKREKAPRPQWDGEF